MALSDQRLEAPDNGAGEVEVKILDPIIRVENLYLYYGAVMALKDVSMLVPRHQVTAFIGPSGCGKSTLLRCFNRMNDLVENVRVEGVIELDGDNVNVPTLDVIYLRRRVGHGFPEIQPVPQVHLRERDLRPADCRRERQVDTG